MTGFVLPPEREGRPAPNDLAARRAGMTAAFASTLAALPRAPIVDEIAGRQVLRFRPEGPVRGYLVHFHGGGFRLGAPEQQADYHIALAGACDVEVIAPRYRLAPEHPFPASLADALAVVTALRAEIGDAPLIVAGDSAGGALASGVTLVAAQAGSVIDGVVLHSSWLDLTVTAEAFIANAASDPIFSFDAASAAADGYLQGHDPRHPLASPLFADITAFPSTLITVGTGEVLSDDSLRFHARLQQAGLAAELLAIDGMEHCAVTRSPEMTGAAETFARTAAFVEAIVHR